MYIATFFYLADWLLYTGSAVIGFGAALIWTAQVIGNSICYIITFYLQLACQQWVYNSPLLLLFLLRSKAFGSTPYVLRAMYYGLCIMGYALRAMYHGLCITVYALQAMYYGTHCS